MFTVTVTDSSSPSQMTSETFTINVVQLSITTSSVPNGVTSAAFQTTTLQASGGTTPYSWSIVSGALPSGLTLTTVSNGGQISGTPTVSGSYSFEVQVRDSSTPTNLTATAWFSITIASQPVITTASLPNGTQGSPYSQQINYSGGLPPYSWSITSGSLPAGLSLSGPLISGTPTATGTSHFTIQVADSTSPTGTASQALSIQIVSGLAVATTSPLPSATATVTYSQSLTTTGGTNPYTWTVISGSLPQGVGLNAAGTFYGAPTSTSGNAGYTFTVKVTDSSYPTALTATKTFYLYVGPGLVVRDHPGTPFGIIPESHSPCPGFPTSTSSNGLSIGTACMCTLI
jgi:hypothetical protein